MTITELQIQFDLNPDNHVDVLNNADPCQLTDYGYLFVDQEDGQCYLFDRTGNLDDINKVKSIETIVFANCKSLIKFKIPNSTKWIGNWTFVNCISLKSIEIPDSVKSIGSWAFDCCTSLKSIEIPDSVKSIGNCAFWECKSLKEVVFRGKTMKQVKTINNYPWGLQKSVIKTES